MLKLIEDVFLVVVLVWGVYALYALPLIPLIQGVLLGFGIGILMVSLSMLCIKI